jgi:hypothetical protein
MGSIRCRVLEVIRCAGEPDDQVALRLNARFGYRPGVGRIYLGGPLSGV